VQAGGAGGALAAIILFPIVVSAAARGRAVTGCTQFAFPTSLIVAELSTMLPSNGSKIAWTEVRSPAPRRALAE
jgi:hypothetical protein